MTLTFSRVTPAGPLLTLAEAKVQLRIPATDTASDADITAKMGEAQELILARLGSAGDATWTGATVPLGVRSMIKLMLDCLYERRGGDETAEQIRKNLEAIDQLMGLYRDPTLA
jgi:hypothetical protein